MSLSAARPAAWLSRSPDLPFAALLIAIAVLRGVLLYASQAPANGDDAAVGVMAQRILAGEAPSFASVADRHGGSVLVAHLVAASFALLGVSELALKLVPLLLSLVALASVYLFVRAVRGPQPALLCALVYATSVSLMKWSFYAPGGYVPCQALLPVVLWLLHRRCLDPDRARPLHDVVLGVLCGLGVYLLEIFVAAAFTALLFLVARVPWRRGAARGARFCLGVAVGVAPLLLYGRGLDEVRTPPQDGVWWGFAVQLWRALSAHVPRMMAYDNIEGFPAFALVPNGISYALVLLAVAALLRWRPRSDPRGAPRVEASLLCYVGLYLLLYSLHPSAGEAARHLLMLEPALSILVGLGLDAALLQPRFRWAAAGLLVVALVNSGWQHVRLAQDDRIQGPRGTSEPGLADGMIAFLEARHVRHLITEDWDLAWRVVFKTERRILACHSVSAVGALVEDAGRRSSARYAVLVGSGSHKDVSIRHRLDRAGIVYERHEDDGRAIYVFGSGGSSQRAPDDWCPADARS